MKIRVFASYGLLSVLFTYPLLKAPSTTIEWGHGDPLLNAYVLSWGGRAVWRSPLQIFDASFYYPSANTLSLSDHLLSVSLPFSPLAFLANPILEYNVVFLLSFFLSALLFYAWLRSCRLSPFAAWIGGILFGFMPYRYAQLGHAQLCFTWWIPAALWAFEAWLQRPRFRSAVLTGAAGAAVFLASVYHGFFFLIFFAVFAVVRIGLLEPARRGPLAARSAQVLAMIGTAAVLLAPSFVAYRANSARLPGAVSFAGIVLRGADLGDYGNPPGLSRVWGRWFRPDHPYSDFPWEMHAFPGLLALLSVPIGIALLLRRSKPHRGLTVALVAAGLALFLVSLGPVAHAGGKALLSNPVYTLLYDHLPGFFALRVPARASFYVALAGAALFALALDSLLPRVRSAARIVLALAVAAAAILDVAPRPLPYIPPSDYVRLRAAMADSDPPPGDRGSDLVLPICDELNYAAPLASAPRLRPILNGKSGYLLRLNGVLFDHLQDVPGRSLPLLRAAGVTRILIDRMRDERRHFAPLLEKLRQSRILRGDRVVHGDYEALALRWD